MAVNRIYEIAGLIGIAGSILALCTGLAAAGHRVNVKAMPPLGALSARLVEAGLRRRDDVVIEINGREVALGFSRSGCDGLLLMGSLPQTAQGWSHIAPRLDLSPYRVRYLYDGALHARVPRLQRLGDRLLAELRPDIVSSLPRLMAIAEAGNCSLLQSAMYVLKAFSQGQSIPAQLAGA